MSKKTNYSHETSKPAYQENASGKLCQKMLVLKAFESTGGTACLKQIEQILANQHGLTLPQSSISGRVGDLRREKKVFDTGNTTTYDNKKRKLFALVTSVLGNSVIKKTPAKTKPKVKSEVKSAIQKPNTTIQPFFSFT